MNAAAPHHPLGHRVFICCIPVVFGSDSSVTNHGIDLGVASIPVRQRPSGQGESEVRIGFARKVGICLAAGVIVVGASACTKKSDDSGSGASAATATSAAEFGGLDKLVAAAKKEGTVNLITLPRDWAGYGDLMDNFGKKYGIKVVDDNPDGSSADEINAIKSLKGQQRAPDAVDIGLSFAVSGAAEGLFAKYKVASWADIADNQKAADGAWLGDYGGFVSIGCDAARVTVCPKTFADLSKPEYKNKVALNGDPTKANAAFNGVWAAALANGGSVDDIAPGIAFFGKLKQSGNFVPVAATAATIQSGETPIVIDWDYLNAAKTRDLAGKGVTWSVAVPTDGTIGGYYVQAINADAPHPAAARLWQEYLYSNEGQNGFLKGYARPVRLPAMQSAGTVDASLVGNLPKVESATVYPTDAQSTKAKEVLTAKWATAIR